jgi:hypothetical protein
MIRRTPRDGVLGVHRIRDRAGGAADAVRARDQRDDGRRRSRRLIFDEHAVTTTVGDQVLAQQQAGRRIEEADVLVVPLHTDGAADPAGRRGVVRAADLDEAVEVDGALGEGVVAKGLDRQRAQVRALVGEGGPDLALGGAVDAGVGPALVPVIEPRLRLVERLEAQPAHGLLCVRDAGLDLALAIGIADAARQADDAVVREHIAVQRVEQRVVDVGLEDAFAQVVEHDGGRRAAEPAKACSWSWAHVFVDDFQVSSRTALRLCASVSRKRARPSVLARRRVPHHRPVAVVDLRLFAGPRRDHDARLGFGGADQAAHEALHRGVPRLEVMAVDELLPDRHRRAAVVAPARDQLAVRLAGARAGRDRRPRVGDRRRGSGRFCGGRVGDHLRQRGPVLAATRPGHARRSPRPSGTRWPSRAARRPRARYAATTSPAGPAPLPVVASFRSRRWPFPSADHWSGGVVNVPRAAFSGRFSGDQEWPVFGDHRGMANGPKDQRVTRREWLQASAVLGARRGGSGLHWFQGSRSLG